MSATTERPKDDYLLNHRFEMFAELEFDADQALELAEAKDSTGFALYWGDVKKALDQGASHKQAFAIFS